MIASDLLFEWTINNKGLFSTKNIEPYTESMKYKNYKEILSF